jgi:hypothetical protein
MFKNLGVLAVITLLLLDLKIASYTLGESTIETGCIWSLGEIVSVVNSPVNEDVFFGN